jgi:hypothetical protein
MKKEFHPVLTSSLKELTPLGHCRRSKRRCLYSIFGFNLNSKIHLPEGQINCLTCKVREKHA